MLRLIPLRIIGPSVLVAGLLSPQSPAAPPQKGPVPVVFDNFVWFKDEEIVAALRERIPSFDGTVPATGGVPELLRRELQNLLQSKRIPGQVDLLPQSTLKGAIESYMFRVTAPGPKVCALKFVNASAIKDAELADRLPVVGSEYSRSYIANASRGTLIDVYRQRGHWRASFGPATTTLEETQACSGVSVTLTVQEGPAFAWDRAEWTGNVLLASRDLDALLPVKAGELASVSKLEEGLRRVQKAYGKQGHVLQRATYAPRLDEAARRAIFEIRIEEGRQFRAGTTTFPGLSAADAATLSKQWRLRPGDVFDATYPDLFLDEEIFPRLPRGAKPPVMESQIDAQKGVVNVKFVFGG
jgi:hypothetical protein